MSQIISKRIEAAEVLNASDVVEEEMETSAGEVSRAMC